MNFPSHSNLTRFKPCSLQTLLASNLARLNFYSFQTCNHERLRKILPAGFQFVAIRKLINSQIDWRAIRVVESDDHDPLGLTQLLVVRSNPIPDKNVYGIPSSKRSIRR